MLDWKIFTKYDHHWQILLFVAIVQSPCFLKSTTDQFKDNVANNCTNNWFKTTHKQLEILLSMMLHMDLPHHKQWKTANQKLKNVHCI